jgi:hypothetical protein
VPTAEIVEVTTTRGRLYGDQRPALVHLPHLAHGARADHAGDVVDDVAAAHRAAHRLHVEHVAADGLDLEAAEAVEALRVAVAGAHVVPALDERSGDMCADEAGRAGNQHVLGGHPHPVPTGRPPLTASGEQAPRPAQRCAERGGDLRGSRGRRRAAA